MFLLRKLKTKIMYWKPDKNSNRDSRFCVSWGFKLGMMSVNWIRKSNNNKYLIIQFTYPLKTMINIKMEASEPKWNNSDYI